MKKKNCQRGSRYARSDSEWALMVTSPIPHRLTQEFGRKGAQGKGTEREDNEMSNEL